jgi:hypothetical protein
VEFEEGDISLPIWSGCYWESGADPQASRTRRGDEASPGLQVRTDRRSHHQQLWSYRFATRPYFIGAPDDRSAERMRAVFMNVAALNMDGKPCYVTRLAGLVHRGGGAGCHPGACARET